jgi:hypothetical protein
MKNTQDENGGSRSVDHIVRQGWRAFECDECGHKWEWPSRDRFSPSGENCPECGEWLFPCGNREDASLPVDESGNLKIAWNTLPNTTMSGIAGDAAPTQK